MKLGIDAAKKAGGVCEAVVCYTGDVANPKKTKYTLQYYLDFVDQLVAEGIHVLGIKDMAGLLKPEAARMYAFNLVDIFSVVYRNFTGSLVLSARSTLISPSTSTRTILPVSLLPACSLLQRQALMLLMWLLTVRPQEIYCNV